MRSFNVTLKTKSAPQMPKASYWCWGSTSESINNGLVAGGVCNTILSRRTAASHNRELLLSEVHVVNGKRRGWHQAPRLRMVPKYLRKNFVANGSFDSVVFPAAYHDRSESDKKPEEH